MKRVLVAVAILVIIPVLIALDHRYVTRTTSDMIALMNQATQCEQQGDTAGARRAVIVFSTEWKHKNEVLNTFIRHAELDRVTEASARLLPLLDGGEKTEFLAGCEETRQMLEHVHSSEQISLENVL